MQLKRLKEKRKEISGLMPFLKYAGSKQQMLKAYRPFFPSLDEFGDYHEPFLGSGAVFLGFYAEQMHEAYLRGDDSHLAYLSDVNPKLMNIWDKVRRDCDGLIQELSDLNWGRDWKDEYYSLRDRFNEMDGQSAALFIWLNRHCFNGVYREAKAGNFNVPAGSYAQPQPPLGQLRMATQVLDGAYISAKPWQEAVSLANAGAFVYLDPPYWPVNEQSFTEYGSGRFSIQDQMELFKVFQVLNSKNVIVAMSQSNCAAVRLLYKGFDIQPMSRSGAINSDRDKRGRVGEVLIRNFK